MRRTPNRYRSSMTNKIIKSRIAVIRRIADDNGVAHSLEDKLHRDFIGWLARDSYDNPASFALRAKARLILATEQIKFSRQMAK